MIDRPTFTSAKGDPLERMLLIKKAAVPHDVDGEEAGQYIRAMCETRTGKGVDADNKQFTEYSERYRNSKMFAIGRGGTVDLFGFTYKRKTRRKPARTIEQKAARAARKTSGKKHGNHMRQGVVVISGGKRLEFGQQPSGAKSGVSIGNFTVGLYDDRITRVRIHNEGEGHMAKRQWFSANEQDRRYMVEMIGCRIMARVKG